MGINTLSAVKERNTMINDFSIELATSFIQSTEPYPVDFDRLWVWAGYSSKQKAKRKLSSTLKKDLDYSTIWVNVRHSKGSGSSSTEQIYLTVDAAKMFAMMAATEKGQEVREYFLNCEKVVKAIAQSQPQKAPAKILSRNYLPAQKECKDQLKRHGADGRAYSMTENYNNQLTGIESGRRHEVTAEQTNQLIQNYNMTTIELLKRELGFNEGNQYHLGNTARQAMRHGMYEQLGSESVPEKLKPKKERKLLKAN